VRASTPAALAALPVTVLQLLAGIVLVGAGFLMLARSGNQSDIAPSGLELALRAHLTTILQVRPRFKNSWSAWPALMLVPALLPADRRALGLAVRARDRAWDSADVVDTFSHLHTPLAISLLRVVNGAVIGIVVAPSRSSRLSPLSARVR
jgi:hypothetical protein